MVLSSAVLNVFLDPIGQEEELLFDLEIRQIRALYLPLILLCMQPH